MKPENAVYVFVRERSVRIYAPLHEIDDTYALTGAVGLAELLERRGIHPKVVQSVRDAAARAAGMTYDELLVSIGRSHGDRR